jgi:general secretion pathway protein G
VGLFGRRKKDIIVGKGVARPHRHKLRRRLEVGVAVALCCTAVVLAAWHEHREADRRVARLDMELVVTAVRRFRQDHGRCPHDLGELAHPPAGGVPYIAQEPEDPWGRPYFFQCPGRWDERDVDIASRGPDGSWGAGDDITTDL